MKGGMEAPLPHSDESGVTQLGLPPRPSRVDHVFELELGSMIKKDLERRVQRLM